MFDTLTLYLALLFFVLPFPVTPIFVDQSKRVEGRVPGGVHVPLYRREVANARKRSGQTGVAGLGDTLDVTYNVLIQVGGTQMPVVLDTGSSDLWVLSTSSRATASPRIPLYDPCTFEYADLDARLEYGDSLTGTHAAGPVGRDTVSLAGIQLPHQYFAAINDTNTTVLQLGSAGILGLGFPLNSVIWNQVFTCEREIGLPPGRAAMHDPWSGMSPHHNSAIRFFAKSKLNPPDPDASSPHPELAFSRRSSSSRHSRTSRLFSSYATLGPFVSRLVAQNRLAFPMFAVTLQRDAIQIGGNQGMLSIGELPESVKNESLTWVPVRGYTPAEGGLNPPADTPNEVYPITWEIPVNDVYFDGIKLPRSQLSSPNISLSALLDTGNSLIRGPIDVVSYIIDDVLKGSLFACSTPHTLAFEIGGKMFPVDPRDFVSQAYVGTIETCVANLVHTDVPVIGEGYLYSWSLGDPFLKGVLAAFYYGNFDKPSQDPARIGLLSTVPSDAAERLVSVIKGSSASTNVTQSIAVHNLPMTSDTPPSLFPPATTTGAGGVPQAPTSAGNLSANQKANDVREGLRVNVLAVGLGLGIWVLCRIFGQAI